MSLAALKGLFSARPLIDDLAAVRPGRARLTGIVKAGAETLRSPIKSLPCVAFFYRAFYAVQGRTGWVERTLRRAEVYAPVFFLEMKGGTVRVLSKSSAPFSAEEHREVASRGFPRFKAEEQAVRPGTRIVVKGRVARDSSGLAVHPRQIQILDAEPLRKTARRPKTRPRPKRK